MLKKKHLTRLFLIFHGYVSYSNIVLNILQFIAHTKKKKNRFILLNRMADVCKRNLHFDVISFSPKVWEKRVALTMVETPVREGTVVYVVIVVNQA